LAWYYILDGTIFQAPSLYAIFENRLIACTYHLNQAFQTLSERVKFHPSKGYFFEFPEKANQESTSKSRGSNTITTNWDIADFRRNTFNIIEDLKQSKEILPQENKNPTSNTNQLPPSNANLGPNLQNLNMLNNNINGSNPLLPGPPSTLNPTVTGNFNPLPTGQAISSPIPPHTGGFQQPLQQQPSLPGMAQTSSPGNWQTLSQTQPLTTVQPLQAQAKQTQTPKPAAPKKKKVKDKLPTVPAVQPPMQIPQNQLPQQPQMLQQQPLQSSQMPPNHFQPTPVQQQPLPQQQQQQPIVQPTKKAKKK